MLHSLGSAHSNNRQKPRRFKASGITSTVNKLRAKFSWVSKKQDHSRDLQKMRGDWLERSLSLSSPSVFSNLPLCVFNFPFSASKTGWIHVRSVFLFSPPVLKMLCVAAIAILAHKHNNAQIESALQPTNPCQMIVDINVSRVIFGRLVDFT